MLTITTETETVEMQIGYLHFTLFRQNLCEQLGIVVGVPELLPAYQKITDISSTPTQRQLGMARYDAALQKVGNTLRYRKLSGVTFLRDKDIDGILESFDELLLHSDCGGELSCESSKNLLDVMDYIDSELGNTDTYKKFLYKPYLNQNPVCAEDLFQSILRQSIKEQTSVIFY